jgi:hypothetical protein
MSCNQACLKGMKDLSSVSYIQIDWANFSVLGNCFLWAVFYYTSSQNFWAILIQGKKLL